MQTPTTTLPTSGLLLQGCDTNQFADDLTERVISRIEPLLLRRTKLVDGDTMAELLSVSRPTLDRDVKAGRIPFGRIGARKVFDVEAVMAAVLGNSQPDAAA